MAIGNGQEGVTRWETSMAIIRLLCSGIKDYHFYICPGGGCDVAHARNLMTHEFLTRTDCGIMLQIDSDIVFQPEHVLQLLRRLEQPHVYICAGLYPLKGSARRWSYGLWHEKSEQYSDLWNVGEVCTGFLAMRHEVIARLIAKHPEIEYRIDDARFRGETGHELFAMGPIEARDWEGNGQPYRRRMSEDFMFSMRARDAGFPLYVDPAIQLGHVGAFDFSKLPMTNDPVPRE
jgi:hypothetical protein